MVTQHACPPENAAHLTGAGSKINTAVFSKNEYLNAGPLKQRIRACKAGLITEMMPDLLLLLKGNAYFPCRLEITQPVRNKYVPHQKRATLTLSLTW
jgi:hypothetical protein